MSSHGLFAATGKKSKPVAGRDDDGKIIKVPRRARQEDDFEPTPPEPTRSFCKAELDRIRQFSRVIEPAAGNGCMATDIEECTGGTVLRSDVVDRGCGAGIISFYDMESIPKNSAIITNPPFVECHNDAPWVRHALEVLKTEYLALLLPLSWLGAANKSKLFEDHPPSVIYLMRWRIDFTGMGANPSNHCWYVWGADHVGETIFRCIDFRDDPRQPEMF